MHIRLRIVEYISQNPHKVISAPRKREIFEYAAAQANAKTVVTKAISNAANISFILKNTGYHARPEDIEITRNIPPLYL